MRHKRKTFHVPKGFKFALTGLCIALGVLLGGAWYWNKHKKEIIKSKIEDAIVGGSQGLYRVSYDSLELDEVAGWLVVQNLHLSYDSLRYASFKAQQSTPPLLLNIKIPEIRVSGIQTPRAVLQKEIKGRMMEIKNPIIDIYYTYQGKDSARNVPTRDVYEQILGNLKFIEIDTIAITGGQVRTNNIRTGKVLVELKNFSIVLAGVKIDSVAQEDPNRILFSEQLNLSASEVSWYSSNGLYRFLLQDASLESDKSEINAGKFSMIPTVSEDVFVRRISTQADRYDFNFRNITLKGVKVPELINETLIAESLSIPSPSVKVYRDLARPRDNKNRVGGYPHQVLDKIPMTISISKIFVSDAFVEYKEKNHITRKAGKVQFYHTNVTITNFTNDKTSFAENKIMTADIRSVFLNMTPLTTSWVFYLGHPRGRFDVKGSLGPIDGAKLNVLAEPMGPARIEEGKLNGLHFDLAGNDYSMNAKVRLLYNDVKVSILEVDKGSTEADRKSLASFLANTIIKNDNPKGKDPPREANIIYTRDTNRSLFNFCWKSIFEGVKETLGIK